MPRRRLLAALLAFALAVPAGAYESNPGATHTLFLDFGEFTTSMYWPYRDGQGPVNPNAPYTSPALFYAGAPEGFTPAEQDAFIRLIWRRVAEDYAPFDVNVVTVEPSTFQADMDAGRAARVAIGGTSQDLGGTSGKAPPSGYRRPELDRNVLARGRNDDSSLRTPAQIATTAAHEAAHLYGANYHYVDLPSAGNPTCLANDTTGLRAAHLSRFQGQARDKWWSDRGFGNETTYTTCRIRGDVGEIWTSLGIRGALAPPGSVNPLHRISPTTLAGHGVVLLNGRTWVREQEVDWRNGAGCGSDPNCEFQPIPLGYTIGVGPDQWRFRASAGSIRVRVDTINRELGADGLTALDPTSANLDADFALWVQSAAGAGTPWTLVSATASRRASDTFSAELYHTVAHTEWRTYVVSVGTREGYGDLGQYTVEVYAANGNLDTYSHAQLKPDPDKGPPRVVTLGVSANAELAPNKQTTYEAKPR